ncbi:pyrimidine-nucleoside phosphorylase [Lactonifactor longoviformis]|uniref:Pyrimidine-nucleoside phosphorylase n=1 Tax=Lactonifactor longoviformis DSM 17459 TaxID=1122155 RepID=A0A1M4UFF7_9CLOT|nr:pyrimidine-nucleoside phosphorylase [Lactonifactor longoviformis]POP32155.1 pyrimidine-nucleoside phosphorylase [Lactonifactor longoviformis]SHE55416.1 pyrimidine-nucleoside phosphorylase [Lactonifactor longoviformis DSM 17459]
MRMTDIIAAKRDGQILSEEQIRDMIERYVADEIPDYQMSAMMMAIYFQGMTDRELTVLTDAMAKSGDMVDLSEIQGIKVDKHSTGGVGDKTTLIAAPIAAACGVKVAKMSGKGLGFTGGTVDKLEAIPGFRTVLDRKEFFDVVNRTGLSVIGQSGNLAPADKKLYALRDVTATVESIPLIAASIMSKKLAAGSDCILLDVKTGSGAFMSGREDARALAEKMVRIGTLAGRKTIALITNMEEPLGNYIGNSLEVAEAVETLRGNGPEDLTELSVELAANMLYLAQKGELETCRQQAAAVLADGTALECLKAMAAAQGGDPESLSDTSLLPRAPYSREVKAKTEGFIAGLDAKMCGMASGLLGAGRETKDSVIDPGAGIILHKKTNDYVMAGEPIATLYTSKEELFPEAVNVLEKAVTLGKAPKGKKQMVYERIV